MSDHYPKYEPKKMSKQELLQIIQTIDNYAPRADKTCDTPGITLSEAVFRKLHDKRQQMARNEARS